MKSREALKLGSLHKLVTIASFGSTERFPVTHSFSNARVLVVGDVMLDRYWHGDAGRISPEAPVPVVRVTLDEVRPGGAANVALNLSALGASVILAGLVGDDPDGALLKHTLDNHGVESRLMPVAERTITKLRVLSQAHQMIRLDFEQTFQAEAAQALAAAADVSGCQALVLSDYAKGTLDPASWIRHAKAASIPVIVDPKGSDFGKYRGATVVTPNRSEFELVAGPWTHEQDLIDKAQALISEFDWQALLVTRSEQGMTLVMADGAVHHFAATAREVADVTGAGDTVVATLAAGLGQGLSLPESVALANRAAGIVVSKLGTASVSARELAEPDSASGVFHETADLVNWVHAAQARGERVVMTNGCFDILHAGHVSYLKEAASLGDRLIVAVNDDASVKRLKGPERPLNTLERRMQVLAGLGAVDAVIGFSEDTPVALISALKPDVLAKGGDYKSLDQVVGYETVLAYGGEVRVLGEVANLSTTHLIAKIRQTDSTN